MELCEKFFALNPPTRLKLRDEVLSGTVEALTSGQADLALGGSMEAAAMAAVQTRLLGQVDFVFAVAPHHPLARADEPLGDQDVLTVPSLQAKLEAQLRGLGAGFLPECMARPYVKAGHLVVRQVDRPQRLVRVGYAWRQSARGKPGRALQWWLAQLEKPGTRKALLEQHHK